MKRSLPILTTSLLFLSACGGTEPAVETAPPAPEPEPAPAPQPEPEPEAPVVEAEPEPAPEPAPEPLVTSEADEVREALFEAATDVVALRRLIDPDWGVGVYAPEEDAIGHYCDMGNLASHRGLGFLLNVSDTFRCNSDLTRCSVADTDGRGFSFHFRRGSGDALYLNTVVHHERRVPNTDSQTIMAFVEDGDGVCALRRSLSSAQTPTQFSVFVSEYTGQAEETLSTQLCGEEAGAAYGERVSPVVSREPSYCTRGPVRCVFATDELETAVYARDGSPVAVAITRPGMRRPLDRGQTQQLASFLLRHNRHRCQ